jgi:hypothetical protein
MVHKTLQDLMRQDYEYLKSVFEPEPEPVNSVHTITIEKEKDVTPKQSKRGRKPKAQAPQKPENPPPEAAPETKNILIQSDLGGGDQLSISSFIPTFVENNKSEDKPPTFKDPKEQKAWQKEMEAKKKAENDALGISFSQILTRENLKQWIEVEGKTYAWVAREKAGCPDAQVAATAQMMGIKSSITKKRAMIMNRH